METIKLEITELQLLLELVNSFKEQIVTKIDEDSKKYENAPLILKKKIAEKLIEKIEEKLKI